MTDGISIWVVDDQTLDKVYEYKFDGTPLGSWAIDPANPRHL